MCPGCALSGLSTWEVVDGSSVTVASQVGGRLGLAVSAR
jgi:hypothetical protein